MAEADLAALTGISTATITMALFKQGLRNVWLRGAAPLAPGQPRIAGPAFTFRFLPGREDLATVASLGAANSTRVAIEQMPEGCIAVVDALGTTDAGTFGDILCARMARRGVAGLVTDGMVRDVAGIETTGLPIWCRGVAAPPSITHLVFAGWNDPIACGGTTVYPDDIIVADRDGAVVIPRTLLPTVLETGQAQEDLEAWILDQVNAGADLPGLYPPSPETLARYKSTR